MMEDIQEGHTGEDREISGGAGPLGRIGYRPYGVLLLSVVIRAVHQVGAAVYLTSFITEAFTGPPGMYLWMAVLSGFVLLFTESLRHRQVYREMAGIGTFIKLFLLGAAYHQVLPVPQTVLAAFVLASISAHLPKDIRHRLVF